MQLFTAASNDDMLNVHKTERVDLIISHLDMPGMNAEQMSSFIRGDADLRAVRLIMICANNRDAIEHCSRCRPDAMILSPIDPALLLARAQQLLNITLRENVRILIKAVGQGNGNPGDGSFFCRLLDISASGMLIETDKNLTQGARLTCSFFLPDSIRIQASGEIVRSLDRMPESITRQFGVKFSDMTAESKKALEAFLANRSFS
jgi:CheY-like chemotaxis protein